MPQGETGRLSTFPDSHAGKLSLKFVKLQVVTPKAAQAKTLRKFTNLDSPKIEFQSQLAS
jgi:hypothetical protein